MEITLQQVAGLAVAILGGAAVGVERQRSGHATGPHARFGGVRTFTLLGTLAGVSGLLVAASLIVPAALMLVAALGLVIVGYVRASANDIDATTEVAALVVIGAGVLAGLAEKHDLFSADARLLLFTGLLGGFTTFSAFGLETMFLLRKGELLVAGGNIALSVAAGLLALWLGLGAARA